MANKEKQAKAPKQQAKPKKEKLLPTLSESAQAVLDAFTSLTPADRTAFTANATELVRSEGVKLSKELLNGDDNRLAEGDEVVIVSGSPKYLGQKGTVTKVRRVRVFVKPEGSDKSVYLFTSDVRSITSPAIEETNEALEIEETAEAVNG